MFIGALISFVVNCTLIEISLSPFFSFYFGLLFMAVGFLIFFRAGSINVDPEDCANLWLISQHDELMHSLSFQDPACLAGCKYQTCYT